MEAPGHVPSVPSPKSGTGRHILSAAYPKLHLCENDIHFFVYYV